LGISLCIGGRGLFSIVLALGGLAATCSVVIAAGSAYTNTIAELQNRYVDEVVAHQKYNTYAQRAVEEGYPNIAHLFRALAASEAVHARNFKKLLAELDVEARLPAKFDYEIASTKKNIRHATTVEADEIDQKYPAILESIESEKHEDAIRYLTYAWKAEKQHRDLIVKIQKASKRWFGIVAKRIEGKPTRYYVCQVCGSTLIELPAETCPIGAHPVSEYREVPGFPGNDQKKRNLGRMNN